MSSFYKIIELLKAHIKELKLGSFKDVLGKIGVESLESAKADKLFAFILDLIVKTKGIQTKNDPFIDELMHRWYNKNNDDDEIEGDELTVFEATFFNSNISERNLNILAHQYREFTYFRIMYDVVDNVFEESERDKSGIIDFGLARISKIYKPDNIKELTFLRDRAADKENTVVFKHLVELVKTVDTSSIPPPSWILRPKTGLLPTEQKLKKEVVRIDYKPTIPNSKTLTDLLVEESSKYGIVIENPESIIEGLNSLKFSDKMSVYDLIPSSVELKPTEKKIFQVYGPSNSVKGMELSEYLKFKDRMFEFDYFDIDETTDADYSFNNYCWQCKEHVKYKWYTVRLPLVDKGWVGWFCSWKCAEDNFNEQFDEMSNGERYQTITLIQKYKNQLNKYGIIDRK